jgi:hypothetical protein
MERSFKQALLTAPGIGVALMPRLMCPRCWPFYAGILSSVGLGFSFPQHIFCRLRLRSSFSRLRFSHIVRKNAEAMDRSSWASSQWRQS